MAAVVTDTSNGMEKVVLRSSQGETAEVYLHGAHVVTWKDAEGRDLMFTSKQAIFQPPKAIRGGVPVCFPQFGGLGPLGQHGFARNSMFRVTEATDNKVVMVLVCSGSEDARYPHPFQLTIRVELAPHTLVQHLAVRNTGSSPMEFTAALHTYYQVPAIGDVRVTGLEGTTYSNSLAGGERVVQEGPVVFDREVDRIYINTPAPIRVTTPGLTFTITKPGFPDAVVWNPWVDKSRAMADFGDEEYKEMLCIEPAMALSGPYSLAAGAEWSGTQELSYTRS